MLKSFPPEQKRLRCNLSCQKQCSIHTSICRFHWWSRRQVLLEPYSKAYYFGSQRVSTRYQSSPVQDNATFQDIKLMIEKEAVDTKELFVKDMAYYLPDNDDLESILPDGFQHTFLIREPHKSIKSLYKMSTNKKLTGWDTFESKEAGFKELWQLFNLVKLQNGTEPIVIDADDLLNNPGKIVRSTMRVAMYMPICKLFHAEGYFRRYCQLTGLPYEDSMLSWNSDKPSVASTDDWKPWFEGVLSTNSFIKPLRRIRQPSFELPQDIQEVNGAVWFFLLMRDHFKSADLTLPFAVFNVWHEETGEFFVFLSARL